MGYAMLPVVIFAIMLALTSVISDQNKSASRNSAYMQSEGFGQTFIAYRDAVFAYHRSNPSFTGTVPTSALSLQGSQFSPTFLAMAGNAITAASTSGRVVTAYANLPAGAVASAKKASGNDAALGLASGTTWRSFAPNAADVTLPISVPNGSVVSITQTGS
jgi:hypothetical protein